MLFGSMAVLFLHKEEQHELCHQYSQEHGQGINGAVAHGRSVVTGGLSGESQSGGVGVRTCDETHQGEIVELQLQTTDNADDKNGDGGDEETGPHIGNSITVGNRIPERCTGLYTHTGEEQDESHFA